MRLLCEVDALWALGRPGCLPTSSSICREDQNHWQPANWRQLRQMTRKTHFCGSFKSCFSNPLDPLLVFDCFCVYFSFRRTTLCMLLKASFCISSSTGSLLAVHWLFDSGHVEASWHVQGHFQLHGCLLMSQLFFYIIVNMYFICDYKFCIYYYHYICSFWRGLHLQLMFVLYGTKARLVFHIWWTYLVTSLLWWVYPVFFLPIYLHDLKYHLVQLLWILGIFLSIHTYVYIYTAKKSGIISQIPLAEA